MTNPCKELESVLAGLEADARRYRWLRDNIREVPVDTRHSIECDDLRMKFCMPYLISVNCINCSISLDEAIDMEIQKPSSHD